MKSNTDDYLKYWKVIRQFIKVKYGLNQCDLDMILFLYSEKYFNTDRFDEFQNLVGWDKTRFARLKKDGWIEIFRRKVGKRKQLYALSKKTINLVRLIYRKLNGEEIPVSQARNKMFAKNVSYSDKVYRNMILEMNAFIKQQRHRALEQ